MWRDVDFVLNELGERFPAAFKLHWEGSQGKIYIDLWSTREGTRGYKKGEALVMEDKSL